MEENENQSLTIKLGNKLNFENADLFYNEVKEIVGKNQHDSLILDASDLKSISSSGLRILLKISKVEKDMIIDNVSPEVYDIFDMTGFSSIFDINVSYQEPQVYKSGKDLTKESKLTLGNPNLSLSLKGLKTAIPNHPKNIPKVSIKDCDKIDEGLFANVYKLNPDTIVKVAKGNNSEEKMIRELSNLRKAIICGVPTCIPFNLVEVEDKLGMILEYLEIVPLNAYINNHKEKLDQIIDQYGAFLRKINLIDVGDLAFLDRQNLFAKEIPKLQKAIAEDDYKKILTLFSTIPKTNTFLHYDLHIGNLLYNEEKGLFAIDMDTASKGNPIFELCCLAFPYIVLVKIDNDFAKKKFGESVDIFNRLFYDTMKKYFQLNDQEKLKNNCKKIIVLGYIRGLIFLSIRKEIPRKIFKYCYDELKNEMSSINNLILDF